MQTVQVVIALDIPAVTLEEYARRSGQGLDRVRQQAKLGKLPILQAGKNEKTYVNLVAMYKTCAEAAQWDMRAPSTEYQV